MTVSDVRTVTSKLPRDHLKLCPLMMSRADCLAFPSKIHYTITVGVGLGHQDIDHFTFHLGAHINRWAISSNPNRVAGYSGRKRMLH